MQTPLAIDGHNDLLLQLWQAGGVAAADGFLTGLPGHLDLPKVKAGGLGAGFFAIFVPSPVEAGILAQMIQPAYDLPLPDPVPQGAALRVALGQAAILLRLETLGALRICRTTADLRACLASGTLGAVLHMEGAEAIDHDFHALDVLYAAGLRSLGPVWSRANDFGGAVPFRYPSGPEAGPGLTPLGKRLVKTCAAKGILVDLSHMNAAGFWDVVETSDAPLVATHSNAHALCPHARNLTDAQLDAIRERDGMVGLNFAAAFLREDGRMIGDVPLETMMRHLDYLIDRLGEDRVGLGSDFDGAIVPDKIGSVAGLTHLRETMQAHGFTTDLMEKLLQSNWLRVLDRIWAA